MTTEAEIQKAIDEIRERFATSMKMVFIKPSRIANIFGPSSKCECGSHKATGAGFRAAGHSSWCPWKEG